MLAYDLLSTNKTVKERAATYASSMKRNLQKQILDALVEKKEKLEDELFDLKNFTLDTNLNAGLRQMTKEDCEKRFTKIIDNEYELELISAELAIKQKSFNKYFSDEVNS
jgi:AraC-like DNA-binding protein